MKDILKSDNGGAQPTAITLEILTGTSEEAMREAVQKDGYYMFRLDRIEPEARAVQSAIGTINEFFMALGLGETWREAFTGYVDDPAMGETTPENSRDIAFTPDVCENPGDFVYSTAAYWANEWQSDNRPVNPTNSRTFLNFDLPDGTELTVGVSREFCPPIVENNLISYAFVFDANVHRLQIPA